MGDRAVPLGKFIQFLIPPMSNLPYGIMKDLHLVKIDLSTAFVKMSAIWFAVEVWTTRITLLMAKSRK